MYETVKVVKGYAITRMVGTKGFYHVVTREGVTRSGKRYKTERTFRTIKAAVEFIETML